MSGQPNGADRSTHPDDLSEAEVAVLEGLQRRPVSERLGRLERRDLVEGPRQSTQILVELGKQGELAAKGLAETARARVEIQQLREERQRDNTAAKRSARILATAILWALTTFAADRLPRALTTTTEPSGAGGRP